MNADAVNPIARVEYLNHHSPRCAVFDTLTRRVVHIGTEDQARNTAGLANGFAGADRRFVVRRGD